MTNLNTLLLHSSDYLEFIKTLRFPFLKTNGFIHETTQHLAEIVNVQKNPKLEYIIFYNQYFFENILKEKNSFILKGVYLPDAIIFNKETNMIVENIQFKTYWSNKETISNQKLFYLENKYNDYWVDKIKRLTFIVNQFIKNQ